MAECEIGRQITVKRPSRNVPNSKQPYLAKTARQIVNAIVLAKRNITMGRKKRKTTDTDAAAEEEAAAAQPNELVTASATMPLASTIKTPTGTQALPAASNYAMTSHSGEIVQEGTCVVTLTD